MVEIRVSAEAESDLDEIWLYIARSRASENIATRIVNKITERFWLLAQHPYVGRRRDDLRPGLRSLVADEYLIIHRVESDGAVLILHILHGKRDIGAVFRE
ncbi:MAG TPA: type II toxin-antitoxin system RelE/ParE family toxin [Silvibacterium sp.]|nr:type II toxin-antitoxin system RelE/ParE family toxin [Silvibacterium sp.]